MLVIRLICDIRFKAAEHLCTQFIQVSSTQEGNDHLTLAMLEIKTGIYKLRHRTYETIEVVCQFLDRITTISSRNHAAIGHAILLSTQSRVMEGLKNPTVTETAEDALLAALDGQRIIAILFKRIERITVSEDLFLRTIIDSHTLLGPAHPMTLLCQRHLVMQYHELQQNKKGEKLYLQIIGIDLHEVRNFRNF